jgi:hypothetical protein
MNEVVIPGEGHRIGEGPYEGKVVRTTFQLTPQDNQPHLT